MDFGLDDTQQAVADLAAGVLRHDPDDRRAVAALSGEAGYDETAWKAMAQAGLLALPLPEACGGDGFGAVEIGLVLTEAGRQTLPLPALATLALGVLPIAFGMNVEFMTREITIGAPATQWWISLSTAIVFGLGFATVLTLIVTPAALMAIASTTAATQFGRAAFTGLLKLVPGAGAIVGGAIGAGVASSFTLMTRAVPAARAAAAMASGLSRPTVMAVSTCSGSGWPMKDATEHPASRDSRSQSAQSTALRAAPGGRHSPTIRRSGVVSMVLRAASIYGGTNEIQKNILNKAVLGL